MRRSIFMPDDIVYIAGPMTGKTLYNYVQFYGYAELLKKEYGCTVLNPARQPNGLTYEKYIERGITDVKRATAMLLLTGWEYSPGARKEYSVFLGMTDGKFVTEEQLIGELQTRIKVKRSR